MKNRRELVEEFLAFELKNDLFSCDDWHYFRLEVYRAIEHDIFATNYSPIYDRQPIMFSSMSGELLKKDILVVDNANRFVADDGRGFNPTTQAVINAFPQSACELSFDFKNNSIMVNKSTQRHLFLLPDSNGQPPRFQMTDLCNKIYVSFRISNKTQFENIIKNLFHYNANVFALRNVFRDLMSQVSPQLVIFENAYNPFFIMLNEVARSLGITTIELQHGHFDSQHIAFNVHKEVREKAKKGVTDKLFVYGSYYKKSARHIIDDKDIIITGNPFFEDLANCYDRELRYDILFVSSTNAQPVREYAIALKRAYKELNILYRLHPEEKMDSDVISALSELGIVVECAVNRNIYETLSDCCKVITYNSTVTYEAVGIGNPVGVIVDEYNMVDDVTSRIVTPIRNMEDLINFVYSDKNKMILTNDFFAKGARRLLPNAINKLLSNK